MAGHRRVAIRLIAAATVVGLAARLAFAVAYWIDKPLTHDEQEYLALARSLATGQGFRYPPAESQEIAIERFGRAPFYPFFLSRIGGQAVRDPPPSSVPSSIKIAQSVVGAAAVPILAAVAWRAAGPGAGIAAAFITAVHPPLVWVSAYALSEAVYVVLAWLSVLFLGMAIDRKSPIPPGPTVALSTAAGLVGGFAALTRPAMIGFLALAAVWLTIRNRRVAIPFVLASAIVIAPWTIRNVREYGRVVLVASEGGITFWTGNHPLAIGEGDMAANPGIKRANRELRLRNPGLTPEELEPIYYREAIGQIFAHPVWWVGLIGRKVFYLLVPIGPSYTLHSSLYLLGSVIPYALLVPFAVAGARRLLQAGAPVSAVWLMLASAILTSLVFFPQERFRIPAIDPTLVVCAAAWLGWRGWRDDGAMQRVERG